MRLYCRSIFSYSVWPMKLPPGKKVAAVATVLQLVLDFFRADAQAHAMSLAEQGFARDQLLRRRLENRQMHGMSLHVDSRSVRCCCSIWRAV